MRKASEDRALARNTQSAKPLPRDVIELTAQRLRVIAEPTRISLLEVLNDGEAGVQELADHIGLAQQITSHHLSVLWRAGVLSRRRVGPLALYSVSDWSAWWVIEQIARWVQSCQDEQGASAPTE
jgi:DNA-binding transcriptional ArsR family regulator